MPPASPINPANVQSALDALDAEIAAAAEQQHHAVFAQYTAGLAGTNIAHTWTLGSLDSVRFRLIYVRAHFVGGAGANPLTISIDSISGTDHDTVLATIAGRGVDNDLNYMVAQEESKDPSPWTFGIGDILRIDWTNPDAFTVWGIEVGLALAL